ncbi:response regulator [Bacillus salitolerans]|uniref:Response regulator n=1 Tax=Bacillus salitolerans TaxID=1437434 RepID=A0ABW4LS79_9BACI
MRILLADDHTLFRAGLKNLLSTVDEMQIVGEASTGEEAIEQASLLNPDIILMDIRMPGLNGIEATKKIRETLPHVHILILSMFQDDQSVFTAMKVGAKGYILKDANEDELLHAIRMIASGGAVFGSVIAARMMDYFAVSSRYEPNDPAYAELTAREREILILISKNATNSQIASELHLSSKTVANYVTNILNKLQVSDRQEAKRIALKWKLNDHV